MIIQMGTHLDLEDGLVRMLPDQRLIFLTLDLYADLVRDRVDQRFIFLPLDLINT